jgi:hypothetical protein
MAEADYCAAATVTTDSPWRDSLKSMLICARGGYEWGKSATNKGPGNGSREREAIASNGPLTAGAISRIDSDSVDSNVGSVELQVWRGGGLRAWSNRDCWMWSWSWFGGAVVAGGILERERERE